MSLVNSMWRSLGVVRGVRLSGGEEGVKIVEVEGGSVFVVLEESAYMSYEYYVFMVGGELIKCVFYLGEFSRVFEELL